MLLNKLTIYKQLKELKKNFRHFCEPQEGYLEWSVPSVDVIYFMSCSSPVHQAHLLLYDPPKDLMNMYANASGIKTPAFALIGSLEERRVPCGISRIPLFVKPDKAGDSHRR